MFKTLGKLIENFNQGLNLANLFRLIKKTNFVNMEIMELAINEDGDGVFAISLVDRPAIEIDFTYFGKTDEPLKFAVHNEEQRIVAGAVLVPNKLIYREDAQGNSFHVFFKPKTVRKAAELYLKEGRQQSSTVHHIAPVKGVSLVQSWIVENPELDTYRNFQPEIDLPVGSWYGLFKVENDEVWEGIKSGEFKGLSIEIISSQINMAEMELLNKLKNKLGIEDAPIVEEEHQMASAVTTDGKTLVTDTEEMAIGDVIFIEIEGERLPLPVGEYELENATVISIAEEGIISGITPAENPDETPMTESEFVAYKKEQEQLMSDFVGALNEIKESFVSELNTLKSQNETLVTENTELKESVNAKLEAHTKQLEVLNAPIVEVVETTPEGKVTKTDLSKLGTFDKIKEIYSNKNN